MTARYIYPGSFCPPTYGHLAVVREAAELFPEVVIVCSTNDGKSGRWFSEETCVRLWQAYDLPANVQVLTLSAFLQEGNNSTNLVMIRGIRDEADLEYEKDVVLLNSEKYGISKYFYILTGKDLRKVSSSAARRAAGELDFQKLSELVAPQVVTALLEKAWKLSSLILVTGLPAAGKSTVLNLVSQQDESFVHINTDKFNQQLQEVLIATYPEADLLELALNEPQKLAEAIKEPWFAFLRQAFRDLDPGSNVLLEIAYGLRPNMEVAKYFGGRVINLSCGRDEARRRVQSRGTGRHNPFISVIPDGQEVVAACAQQRLDLMAQVDTRQLPEISAQQILESIGGRNASL